MVVLGNKKEISVDWSKNISLKGKNNGGTNKVQSSLSCEDSLQTGKHWDPGECLEKGAGIFMPTQVVQQLRATSVQPV